MAMATESPAGTIFSGTRGQYHWLTSTEQYMGHLVQLCPDVLLGRYVIVTSIDGGSPWLTDAQRAAGWELRSGMAYSQRISSVEELFYQRDGNDCPGYDEWYVFDATLNDLGEILNGNPSKAATSPDRGVSWCSSVGPHLCFTIPIRSYSRSTRCSGRSWIGFSLTCTSATEGTT
jgi:hypothetical protein